MNRREFLAGFGAGVASVAFAGCTTALAKKTPGSKDRPNILVIMSDEHNTSVTGCYGNSIVRTPNLDRLAEGGTTFESCYCNSPLCVPSRLSFTAGKYVSRIGAWSNDSWLDSDDAPSLPRILTAAGYDSYLCGKMHYDKTRRYGFTEIGGNMNNGFKTGKGGRRKADDLTPKPGISRRFEQFYPANKSSVLNHDRKVTAGVQDFLKNRKADDKPFFLFTGYLAPHFPLIVPQEYWDKYKGKVPMPVIPKGHLENLPLNYKHLRIGFNNEDVPDDIVRKGRELYYGLTEWLDNEIGKVLKALDQSGLGDNTVVIYTTDHGENMGEHGLWWKNCVYDTAARVPLIINHPARWKGTRRRSEACSLVDVVQTVADLGGARTPADWDGDSMVAWLDDYKAGWKDMAVSEYYAHNIASGYAMIRMGRYKYVYHTRPDDSRGPERELYDLKNDPGEFNNLAKHPTHADRMKMMHAALVEEVGEDPEKTEKRCRADYAKGYGRNRNRKKKTTMTKA